MKSLLITGGSGSLGTRIVRHLLQTPEPPSLSVLSNDESELHAMGAAFGAAPIRYFVGDIRYAGDVTRAMVGIDSVIHAAAIKQIPYCEAHPHEASQVNISGSQNVVSACLAHGVKRVLLISTAKAVNPTSVYGATKLCAERLFVAANFRSENRQGTQLSSIRLGNLVGSAGSVIPVLLAQRRTGTIRMTDPQMTRFWVPMDSAVYFVLRCLQTMQGGEIFVPRVESLKLADLAEAIAPDGNVEWTGLRPGEKVHETLLSSQESRYALDMGEFFVITPTNPEWKSRKWSAGRKPEPGFAFTSNGNDHWVTPSALRSLVRSAEQQA